MYLIVGARRSQLGVGPDGNDVPSTSQLLNPLLASSFDVPFLFDLTRTLKGAQSKDLEY